ncbi:MAG: SPOR domain-containing protein [Candidatus Latescibacteria bacterium]|nr:SPOR domain-containing protein [Candidatus Latescibacterota bacterium]MCK5527804.1 SPOR domain-containing protein [Candidatus Latescibacterota bacterium]
MVWKATGWMIGAAAVFLVSCGGRQLHHQKAGAQEQYEHFDPMSLDDDDISLSDIMGTESSPNRKPEEVSEKGKENPDERAEAADPSDSAEVGTVEMEEASGWRVQIFATEKFEAAQQVKEEALEVFDVPVYVPFETPYYKVRIGNCRTLAQVEELVRTAKQKGYRTAFRARTKILVEKRSP